VLRTGEITFHYMTKFKGTIIPHITIDSIAMKIAYGEIVTLEPWQVNRPDFQFALKNQWVIPTTERVQPRPPAASSPPPTPEPAVHAPMVKVHREAVSDSQRDNVKELLEQQRLSLNAIVAELKQHNAQLIQELKTQLSKVTVAAPVYNKTTSATPVQHSDGFKVQEVEEKFVAKVDDLSVKSSNVVTQKIESSDGIDAQTEMLKKLRKGLK